MSTATPDIVFGAVKIKLQVTEGIRSGRTYSLQEGVNYIGRTGPEEVTMDLTPHENPGAAVKRNRFATVWFDNNGLAIADNGRRVTKINGVLVEPGKRFILKGNEKLRFGKTELQLQVVPKR